MVSVLTDLQFPAWEEGDPEFWVVLLLLPSFQLCRHVLPCLSYKFKYFWQYLNHQYVTVCIAFVCFSHVSWGDQYS